MSSAGGDAPRSLGARLPLAVLLTLAWLVPGLGHLLLGRRMRAAVFAAVIVVGFATGIVLDGVIDAIGEGEKVELRGFGSFRTRKRQARQGRNPRTGARVSVPSKVVPYFKPGKQLREVLGG